MGTELLGMLGIGRQIVSWVVKQANLLATRGVITPEELQAIKTEAGLSDSAWDEEVAAARARTEASGG